MNRFTEHSKTTFFKDSDVIVNGKRLGPAAFESEAFYKHYVAIINRLAELEDRYCNTPQTHADHIRAMTDEELATAISENIDCGVCESIHQCRPCNDKCCPDFWLEWLRQEAEECEPQS